MSKGKKNIKYVTLPYDFIPFPKPYHYPYTKETVPKHDRRDGLSGSILYKITPHSDLAVEVREKQDGGYFLSGSQIRGKVRANLEILSASYPELIDRTPMLYRDVASTTYRERITGKTGIERTIQAGFLQKVGQDFFVVPAQKMGDKNFLSIKEHRLKTMGLGSAGESFSTLFYWGNRKTMERINELQQLQSEIERKTNEIKNIRERLKNFLDQIQDEISEVFTKQYSFNKKLKPIRDKHKKDCSYNYQLDLDRIEKEIQHTLKQNLDEWKKDKSKNLPNMNSERDLFDLFRMMAERWRLKAEIDFLYRQLKKNRKFTPYQKIVFFKPTANNGIERLSFRERKEKGISKKGYLFNSTNAPSKRSHYFVREPDRETARAYWVPPSVINGYHQNLKKFRVTEKEDSSKFKYFYDIFREYEELEKEKGSDNGLIVFFNTERNSRTGEVEVSEIGRTPHFKVKYKTQIDDILGKKDANHVDYANALFGFASGEGEGETNGAYKSRLRFSPAEIKGTFDTGKATNLVLMTPNASACAMYLQQGERGLLTYEDDHVQLNGYKYYHVLQEPIPAEQKDGTEKIVSSKTVLKKGDFHITGKIYFHNLSREELGLLLLSLDWKELRRSEKYGESIKMLTDQLEDAYELIGGAKPYGYGKVKIEVQELLLEKKGTDFASLVLNPIESEENRHTYIDDFISSMGGQTYFDYVHFEQYVQSKIERTFREDSSGKIGTRENPMHIHWENIGKKREGTGGGYPKEWRLRSYTTERE